MHKTQSPAAKGLNIALLISFIVTNLAPLTGILVHKLASVIFLLLCIVHAIVYRKKWKARRFGLLALVLAAFLTGLFGMIFDEVPLVLAVHKAVSIGSVFFLAIHIFVFRKRMG